MLMGEGRDGITLAHPAGSLYAEPMSTFVVSLVDDIVDQYPQGPWRAWQCHIRRQLRLHKRPRADMHEALRYADELRERCGLHQRVTGYPRAGFHYNLDTPSELAQAYAQTPHAYGLATGGMLDSDPSGTPRWAKALHGWRSWMVSTQTPWPEESDSPLVAAMRWNEDSGDGDGYAALSYPHSWWTPERLAVVAHFVVDARVQPLLCHPCFADGVQQINGDIEALLAVVDILGGLCDRACAYGLPLLHTNDDGIPVWSGTMREALHMVYRMLTSVMVDLERIWLLSFIHAQTSPAALVAAQALDEQWRWASVCLGHGPWFRACAYLSVCPSQPIRYLLRPEVAQWLLHHGVVSGSHAHEDTLRWLAYQMEHSDFLHESFWMSVMQEHPDKAREWLKTLCPPALAPRWWFDSPVDWLSPTWVVDEIQGRVGAQKFQEDLLDTESVFSGCEPDRQTGAPAVQ